MEEFLLLGFDSDDSAEILFSSETREDCQVEFDIALNDEETKLNYQHLVVVKAIRSAELIYDVRKYPEESEEAISSGAEVRAIVASSRAAQGPSC